MPFTNLQTDSVNLEFVQNFINVLASRIGQGSIARHEPNVLGVVQTGNDAASARVQDCILLVVSIDDCHLRSLEGHAKSVTHIVLANFGRWMGNAVTLDGDWKVSTA